MELAVARSQLLQNVQRIINIWSGSLASEFYGTETELYICGLPTVLRWMKTSTRLCRIIWGSFPKSFIQGRKLPVAICIEWIHFSSDLFIFLSYFSYSHDHWLNIENIEQETTRMDNYSRTEIGNKLSMMFVLWIRSQPAETNENSKSHTEMLWLLSTWIKTKHRIFLIKFLWIPYSKETHTHVHKWSAF